MIEKFNSIIREIKISILSGDINIIPNIKRLRKGDNLFFDKKYWKIIEEHKEDCIITGSSALLAYGLIKRCPKDVDFILMKDTYVSNRSLCLKKDRYGMDIDENMLGYFIYKNSYVDFFRMSNDINYCEIDGYKFQSPLEIIIRKMKMYKDSVSSINSRDKDIEDIKECLLNLGYNF